MDESKVKWSKLPSKNLFSYIIFHLITKHNISKPKASVIGTLVYFVTVEQNTPNFDVFSYLKALFLIGFSTYVTYITQALFVYGLYISVYTETESADGVMENQIADSICGISAPLLTAAIFIYILTMIPTYMDIFNVVDIVLHSRRVANTEEADDGSVYVTNLLSKKS